MTEITVRVLDESEWSLYRAVRLGALAESPGSFTATLADEADRDEQFWRDRMTRSQWLLAERGQVAQGIVSLGPYEEEPSAAEVFGLYVVPEARGTGVSWRLVETAAARATQQAYLQLYYWVGTNNGRAVGFAKNFGFRTTDYRRPSRSSDLDPGEEIAMVLSLEPDATSAPNPTSGKAASREGPSAETRASSILGPRMRCAGGLGSASGPPQVRRFAHSQHITPICWHEGHELAL